MPRPRQDGKHPRTTTRTRLTDKVVKSAAPSSARYLVHDADLRGFCLAVEATGWKAFKLIYSYKGRKRWYNLGRADVFSTAQARQLAREILSRVYQGHDPQGARAALHHGATFSALTIEYLSNPVIRAKHRALSISERRLRKHVLPAWGDRSVQEVGLQDARRLHLLLTEKVGPAAANTALASASAVFTWAIKHNKATDNPCRLLEYNRSISRDRVLSPAEIARFWRHLERCDLHSGAALKVLLLTGQRPGEIRHMRWEHLADRWWSMPGEICLSLGWCGTKNGKNHRVWLSEPAWEILREIGIQQTGFVFQNRHGGPCYLTYMMHTVSKYLQFSPPVRPHDLRRTHGTTITRLGFGRDAMNRIQNHVEGGIADVYDRYGYERESIQIQTAIAAEFLGLAASEDPGSTLLSETNGLPPPSEARLDTLRR